jgi:hypothetical protein
MWPLIDHNAGLGGAERGEISSPDRGASKSTQDAVDRRERDFVRCGDLDADWAASAAEVDDHPGVNGSASEAALTWTTGQIEVGRQRATVAKGHFQVWLVHRGLSHSG